MRELERIRPFLETVLHYMTVTKEPNLGAFYAKVADGKDLFYYEEDSFERRMEVYLKKHRTSGEITFEEYKILQKFLEDFSILWYRAPDLRFCQCMVNIERFVTSPLEKASNQQIYEGLGKLVENVEVPLYLLTAYHALPCETEVFLVKGSLAHSWDFGTSESVGDGNYGCLYHNFIPYEEPKEGVLERYNINMKEYEEICGALECTLSVGHCGWCS